MKGLSAISACLLLVGAGSLLASHAGSPADAQSNVVSKDTVPDSTPAVTPGCEPGTCMAWMPEDGCSSGNDSCWAPSTEFTPLACFGENAETACVQARREAIRDSRPVFSAVKRVAGRVALAPVRLARELLGRRR